MSIYPNSYDRLCLAGILPYDVNNIVYDKPSEFLSQGNSPIATAPPKDVFDNKKKKKAIDPKIAGLAGIGTYVTGAILSKSKDPVKGLKAICKTLYKVAKIPLNLIKH